MNPASQPGYVAQPTLAADAIAVSQILELLELLLRSRRRHSITLRHAGATDSETLARHASKLLTLSADERTQSAVMDEILVSLGVAETAIAALYPDLGPFRRLTPAQMVRSVPARLWRQATGHTLSYELAQSMVAKLHAKHDELNDAWLPLIRSAESSPPRPMNDGPSNMYHSAAIPDLASAQTFGVGSGSPASSSESPQLG
jgi:hypothetical protein